MTSAPERTLTELQRRVLVAQQIIPVLTSLRRRGLIRGVRRDDGASGSAFVLTAVGELEATQVSAP